MKYILDELECLELKNKGRRDGFDLAEQLLSDVLEGQRDLLIDGPSDSEGRNIRKSISGTVWEKLINRLDGKKDNTK